MTAAWRSAPGGSRPAGLVRKLLVQFWAVLLLILAWHVWVTVSALNTIVMPGPIDVLRDIVQSPGIYLDSASRTLLLAAAGLVVGMALGTALAILTWLSRLLAGLLTPLSLVFASVPVVAIIPVLARIFGYDVRTVFVIVVIISFFPAFVFTGAGLRALPAGADDLFRVLGASRRSRLLLLAIPSALPDWSVALRLAAANGILAAMVAEFLMGTSGLGYLFHSARTDLDMSRALGASVIAMVISVTSFLLATRAEQAIRLRWR